MRLNIEKRWCCVVVSDSRWSQVVQKEDGLLDVYSMNPFMLPPINKLPLIADSDEQPYPKRRKTHSEHQKPKVINVNI